MGAHGTLYFFRDVHCRGNAWYQIDDAAIACFDALVTELESKRRGGSTGKTFNAHLNKKARAVACHLTNRRLVLGFGRGVRNERCQPYRVQG